MGLVALVVAFLTFAPVLTGRTAEGPVPVESEHLIRTWQTEDGLPQNSVTAILQTRDGYFWIGTFNGLARFDGVGFRVFNVANTPALGSDSVTCLAEDRAGRLWIGTDGGSLGCLAAGRFTRLTLTNTTETLMVSAVAEDAAGVVWVASNLGLHRVEGDHLVTPGTAFSGSQSSLCLDRQGNFWVGGVPGFTRMKSGGTEPASPWRPGHAIGVARDEGVWFQGADLKLVRLVAEEIRETRGEAPPAKVLVQSPGGDVWTAAGSHLGRVRGNTTRIYELPPSANAGSVITLYADREGSLWVGRNGGGLSRVRERVLRNIGTAAGLPDNDVVVLARDSVEPDRIWIGGFGAGIGVWRRERYERLPALPWPNRDVYAFCPTRDGRMWIGTRDDHLLCWSAGRLVSDEVLPGEGARVIFEDREGGLWLGSRHDGARVRRADGRVVPFTTREGLSHRAVTAITQDRDGTVWIGTKQGLNRIDGDRIVRFSAQDGLGADTIHTLCVDHEGILWAGTTGGGIARFREGRFVAVSSAQGLPNDVIAQILDDGADSLWLGSNAGIFRVARRELLDCTEGRIGSVPCQVFDRQAGMPDPECAGSFQPSCLRTSDGRLWFATVGGVVIIDPATLPRHLEPPQVYVESVTWEPGSSDLRSPSGTGPLDATLPPDNRNVRIECSAPDFLDPARIQVRMRLEGPGTRWEDTGSRRGALFNHLVPGRYTFHATARNPGGTWNPVGASLAIHVRPFWWQTPAVRIAATLGAGTAILLAVILVHRRRLRRALDRATRESDQRRTRELAAANQELAARSRELESALASVKTLRGLIPICASCKKIRDDRGFWLQVESYVQTHSEARFSHGLCPDCISRYEAEDPQAGGGNATPR